MSLLAVVVSAVVTPAATVTPSLSPSVSPSVTPSVTPVAHAVVAASPSLLDAVNTFVSSIPQSTIIAAGVVLAVLLQALLNRFPWLRHEVDVVQDMRRRFTAVLVPGLLAVGVTAASGQNDLKLAPAVFLGAQVLVWTWKAFTSIWALAVAAQAAKTPTSPTTEVPY